MRSIGFLGRNGNCLSLSRRDATASYFVCKEMNKSEQGMLEEGEQCRVSANSLAVPPIASS